MTRATYVLAATTLVGLVTSVWLWLANRELRDELSERGARIANAEDAAALAGQGDPWLDGNKGAQARAARSGAIPFTRPPSLPDQPKENRNQRRARRNAEFSAMLGRGE